jgi:DNA repair protein RecO (recombination protein O)
MPILLQPAYVLHRRAYRETSFILELFSLDYGRLSVIAKGVRRSKSPQQGLLQSFVPLLVSWSGQGELMTLTHVEAHGEIKNLSGDCLFAGFYLNELLMNLLQKWDPHHDLFHTYQQTLQELQLNQLEQKTLRSFEKKLLTELGYGLWSLQNSFLSDGYYRFILEQGFLPCDRASVSHLPGNVFSGDSLLRMTNNDWDATSLQDAKRLMRLVIASLMGSRSLNSRRLFTQLSE